MTLDIAKNIEKIKQTLSPTVQLVAVSKTKSNQEILEAYQAGQRVFGENKIQEMTQKYHDLPKDIQWHMVGHVQTNKIKYMAPFVSLVHGVDRFKLLKELNKHAQKNNRVINCLLQIHIAQEETKFGLNEQELFELLQAEEFKTMTHICVKGLMGMATFTDDSLQIEKEFSYLKSLYDRLVQLVSSDTEAFPRLQPEILSMGMSGDYQIAIQCGSTMVRIGSHIFGERNY
jgi:pyridoxal phosphate enzyme (YggS family)